MHWLLCERGPEGRLVFGSQGGQSARSKTEHTDCSRFFPDGAPSHTTVCFSAMSDVVDNNGSLFAMNAIDDPVIAYSQAV